MARERRRTGARAAVAGPLLLHLLLFPFLLFPAAGAQAKGARPAPPRFSFAGVELLAPRDSALATLAARGYRTIPGTREAVVAQGTTFDHLSVIRGVLDDSLRVVRWEVKIVPGAGDDPFPDMKRVYDQVLAECRDRYGRPWDTVEHYEFPYERDDGRTAAALRERLATLRATWRGTRAGDRLVVEMDPGVNVVLTYSCAGWTGFEDRTRHRKGRDL